MPYLMLGYVVGVFISMIVVETYLLIKEDEITHHEDQTLIRASAIFWPFSMLAVMFVCIFMMVSGLAKMIAKWIVSKLS